VAGTASTSVHWDNIEIVQRIFNQISDDLKPTARKELRKGTQDIAKNVLIPVLQKAAEVSPVPIAPAMAATSRARADRVVFVKVGAVNPRLSGFRKGQSKYRTGMAWGSELGPGNTEHGNHYAVPRNGSGYWVQPGVRSPGTLNQVKDAYIALLNQIVDTYAGGRF